MTRQVYLIDSINRESRSIFESLYTKLLPPDPIAIGWDRIRTWEHDPREWPLYADLSQEAFFLVWTDLRPLNNGRTLLECLTPQAIDNVKHIIFCFSDCPASPLHMSVEDFKTAHDTLERQIRVFTRLETLRLVLEDWKWILPCDNRQDPKWNAHLDYIDSMKDLKGRPTVKVEIGNREIMQRWLLGD